MAQLYVDERYQANLGSIECQFRVSCDVVLANVELSRALVLPLFWA